MQKKAFKLEVLLNSYIYINKYITHNLIFLGYCSTLATKFGQRGQTHFTTILSVFSKRNMHTCEVDLFESAACVGANCCKQAD